jgi:hypothetical protein
MSNLPNALRVAAPSRPQFAPRRQSSLISPLDSRRLSEISGIQNDEEEDEEDEPPSRYGSYRKGDVSPLDEEIVVHTWSTPRLGSYSTAPALPPLPTVEEDEPLMSPSLARPPTFDLSQAQAGVKGLISKIGSVGGSRPGRRQYSQLDDEADDGEPLGFDISGFEGPGLPGPGIQMRSIGAIHPPTTLGSGMNNVVKAAVTTRHKRGQSLADLKVQKAVQKKADELGEILVVEENFGSTVDLSSIDGEGMSIRGSISATTPAVEKSYLFPVQANQPSWRPVSMRAPYITLLILIAFGLAGLQEFLYQRSSRHNGLLQYTNPKDIPIYTYFAWKYMPTIILVTYGIMWQVTDFEVKRLESYYQLSKREGATARHSLNLDYLTVMSYIIPFMAASYKQWAVVWSSIATLAAGSLLVVLQSVSIYTYPKNATDIDLKHVLINSVWSRLLTSASIVVGILGILLAVSLRRKSGLLSDPKGIAGIASMAVKSHILQDFEGLDTATNAVIHTKLRKRRYNLHNSTLWQGQYLTNAEKQDNSSKIENPHPIMLRGITGIPYILYICLVMGIIPTFIFIPSAYQITKKVPLLTTLATIVKILWNVLDITVRVMQPYYDLSRRHAPPSTLTLDYTGTVPGYLTYRAFVNKHWLVCIVSLGSIFAEVLTVCVNSFTVDGRKFVEGQGGDGSQSDDRSNTTETFRSFWISFGISMFVCIYLIVVASIVYSRRRHIFLPRQPGSIASVLAYIHQSKLLDDFIDTELLDSNAMTKHLNERGKTYAIGWFTGRDKQDHCGVDQEPLLAKYKYGFDYKTTRLAGEEVGGWEYL